MQLRRLGLIGIRGQEMCSGASAYEIDDRLYIGADGVEPVRIDAAAAERGVQEMIGGVGNEDEIVIEERLQPQAHVHLHPFGIEGDADLAIGGLGGRDAFDLAKHAFVMVAQRAGKELTLVVERDLVGALGRSEHRDHDANDGDGHNDPDRDHHAETHVAPTGSLAPLADIRRSHNRFLP